ncbi:hypothetical protein R7070_04590 [Vibrio sp. 1557]|uniref:hypothetical protein n=1 Tax=Vibrio sp. 1557 TaxID=3074561 RepID=UPI002964FEA7|nr:hypothetical protein [Vibrio sp. 1557]MDW2262024.1 hypothetical protein [Vibrio sp. 1557]
MNKLTISVLPDSKAVDALIKCYSYKKVYVHDGGQYFVEQLKPIGKGRETRLQATLTPISKEWEHLQKSYESIFGLSTNEGF